MDHQNLIAIDIHTHAEVSCWNPFDNYGEEYDRAADKYFGSSGRPTIAESVAYYRERKIGLVMFMVDAESNMGRRRIPNEEIAEAAKNNSDIMIAFGSVDPHKGKMGAREARRLIEEHGVKGFKFHPTVQGYHPYDRMAWPIYEVIAEYGLPAIFHTGHSGIGSGMRCGGGLRLEYSNPMHLDDVAIDFPDMQIVMAHPSFPWQDEALSVATHKPNVWIDLSGWSPKYFPKQLVQYANTLLKDRILFGSDYPLITPDRWMRDFEVAGFKPEVMPGILKGNAVRLLRLEYSNPMHLDDVAIDFPDMQIVMAHPSFPWQDEALSVATHKPNVWIDLSGWSPKYFPKQLVQYANTLLKDRILFGSDYPLITPDRWMRDFENAGFKPEVMPGILKGNAVRLLKLEG
jgi:predicted TIM-barrel fold metal-dependent hydrolase